MGFVECGDYFIPTNARVNNMEDQASKNSHDTTSIGNRAFFNRDDLTSVSIPEGVTSIGEWAFAYCANSESITIPDNVTRIGTNETEPMPGVEIRAYSGDLDKTASEMKASDLMAEMEKDSYTTVPCNSSIDALIAAADKILD